MINDELNKYLENSQQQHHIKLVPACQKSDDNLQIKMEIQLKEHCIKNRLTFYVHILTQTRIHLPPPPKQ